MGSGKGYPPEWAEISLQTKIDAGFRCVRCGHPNAIYSPPGADHTQAAIDFALSLGGSTSVRIYPTQDGTDDAWLRHYLIPCDDRCTHDPDVRDHRILTVHHLDGVKANLVWWNLAALCQRCHLTIQGKVKMDQMYQLPHTAWFMPYVAGYYASLRGPYPEEYPVSRAEVEADLLNFLTLGQPHLEDHYREALS